GASMATLNLNGGLVSISSGVSVTVGSSVTVASDNNISITTPLLNLNSLAVLSTSGASSAINIGSPAGSDLTIQLPANSSATIQTTAQPINNVDSVGHLTEATTGSVNIISGQELTFLDSGPEPTTLNLRGGPFVTRTTNAPTTIGTGVTLAP